MKPWVIFNSAMSLDGRIGKAEKKAELSNKLDQDRAENLRSEADALLVESGALPEIEKLESSEEEPKIVIVDSKGEISSNEKFLSKRKLILAIPKQVRNFKIKKLKRRATVIVTGDYTVNLHQLLRKLYRKRIRKVVLEGNGDLTRRMFEESLIDEIYLLVVPLFLGEGMDLIPKLKKIKKERDFSLEVITQYGDQVLLHYLVK